MSKVTALFSAVICSFVLGSCGFNPEQGPAAGGVTGDLDLSLVTPEVTSIMLACGQDVNISDERKSEFEAGLTDILKKPISGEAKFGLVQSRVSGWKLSQPDYEAYLGCVSEQSEIGIRRLEAKVQEQAEVIERQELEQWVTDVALVRVNENLYRWQRYVRGDRWRQFDVTEVEQILEGIKKKTLLV